MTASFRRLNQFFARYPELAVVCHHRPDGDAIGSLFALGRFLSARGRLAELYCFDRLPAYLSSVVDTSQVKSAPDDFWRSAPAALLLDCGDLRMSGLGADYFTDKHLAVLDHHLSNPVYGEVNCLDTQAAATAEIIYRFFVYNRFIIDKTVATALLLGIYTDTDGFSNLATTAACLQAAAELLKRGARFKDIVAHTKQKKTVTALKLWGRALARLRLDKEQSLAVTVIRERDLVECQARAEDSEGVANLLNYLAEVKMAMVLRELPDGTVKGSLRTTDELMDVAKVAKLWGGGGHAKAAGFTVKGRIEETAEGWKIVEQQK